MNDSIKAKISENYGKEHLMIGCNFKTDFNDVPSGFFNPHMQYWKYHYQIFDCYIDYDPFEPIDNFQDQKNFIYYCPKCKLKYAMSADQKIYVSIKGEEALIDDAIKVQTYNQFLMPAFSPAILKVIEICLFGGMILLCGGLILIIILKLFLGVSKETLDFLLNIALSGFPLLALAFVLFIFRAVRPDKKKDIDEQVFNKVEKLIKNPDNFFLLSLTGLIF
jgi:hypothetical protein